MNYPHFIMNNHCLIIDKMHESIIPMLEHIGLHPHYHPDIRREEVLHIIGDYTGLIVRSKTAIDRELIDRAVHLRFVARAGAGLDQLDEKVLADRNITIINAPEGNRDALAEHATGMLLALMNKMHTADQHIRKGIWDREGNRGVELMGKTVGLIGYGYMGQAFARRLSGFGVRVLAYDKYKEKYGDAYAQEADMEALYESADILSLHVPLSSETRFLIDDNFLRHFRKNIFLLNTARGKVIKLKTLSEAIESGKIRGAALDVLENEKLNNLSEEQKLYFNRLAYSESVIFTPHVGGWTFESYEKINRVLADKIKALNLT